MTKMGFEEDISGLPRLLITNRDFWEELARRGAIGAPMGTCNRIAGDVSAQMDRHNTPIIDVVLRLAEAEKWRRHGFSHMELPKHNYAGPAHFVCETRYGAVFRIPPPSGFEEQGVEWYLTPGGRRVPKYLFYKGPDGEDYRTSEALRAAERAWVERNYRPIKYKPILVKNPERNINLKNLPK